MTWELAAVVIAAIAGFVALAKVSLPFIRARSTAEARMMALEAANAQLTDRLARVEQQFESTSLPRGLRTAR